MTDKEWLKNLAHASFTGTAWVHADPDAVRRLGESRLRQAVTDLFELSQDYCAALNDISTNPKRRVRCLPLAPSPGGGRGGFLLLLGRCQLNLELYPPVLGATVVTVQGFQRVARRIHRFAPELDQFGTLAWRMDNALLMTGELIIKRLLEDITRAAYEAGDLSLGD